MIAKRARRLAVIQGALAAAPALAATWVVHGGAPQIPFAPTALGDRVIRLTPGHVATTAIERLGHGAKPLLAASLTLALVAIAVVIAGLVRRAAAAAVAWSFVLFVCGATAPVQPSLAGALAGAVIAGLTYWVALSALRVPRETTVDAQRRRAIFAIGAFTVSVLAASNPLSRAISWLGGQAPRLRTGALARAPTPRRPPFPAIPRGHLGGRSLRRRHRHQQTRGRRIGLAPARRGPGRAAARARVRAATA